MRFENMPEAEVLRHLDQAACGYLSRIRPANEFVVEDCIKAQTGALTQLFRIGRGLSWRGPMPEDALKDLDLIISHYEPKMREKALFFQACYNREMTLRKINAITAKAMIVPALDAAGYGNAEIEYQRYRAKVSLYLDAHRVSFYVGYKSLERENMIPDLLAAIRDLGDAMNRIGGYIKVSR